jgi:Domain of unknown function (DUF4388)
MQLEGNTRQFPLSELIALMGESSVTGVLEIGAPDRAGRIFCRTGQIYHAEAGDQTGFDAIRQMIQTDGAPFRFTLGACHSDETLWPDSLSLIGHLRRQELLQRRMQRHIPSLEWIPALRASGDEEVRLSATLWPALALIDGQRSVAEIAALLGYEPFEVGTLLGQLVARGLAAIKPPQTAAAPNSEQPACDAASSVIAPASEHIAPAIPAASIGFFERLLTSRPAEQPTAKLPRRRVRLPHLIFS